MFKFLRFSGWSRSDSSEVLNTMPTIESTTSNTVGIFSSKLKCLYCIIQYLKVSWKGTNINRLWCISYSYCTGFKYYLCVRMPVWDCDWRAEQSYSTKLPVPVHTVDIECLSLELKSRSRTFIDTGNAKPHKRIFENIIICFPLSYSQPMKLSL